MSFKDFMEDTDLTAIKLMFAEIKTIGTRMKDSIIVKVLWNSTQKSLSNIDINIYRIRFYRKKLFNYKYNVRSTKSVPFCSLKNNWLFTSSFCPIFSCCCQCFLFNDLLQIFPLCFVTMNN